MRHLAMIQIGLQYFHYCKSIGVLIKPGVVLRSTPLLLLRIVDWQSLLPTLCPVGNPASRQTTQLGTASPDGLPPHRYHNELRSFKLLQYAFAWPNSRHLKHWRSLAANNSTRAVVQPILSRPDSATLSAADIGHFTHTNLRPLRSC